ncbi:hypothetical protein FHS29_004874 [Saccharothrix tamanrassetensis]|uniref:Syndecan 1 n=1 Tax=Saccharothrix tamanrassetensis TaxID=1051531 RepID=A0A841CS17_9PSEU|nr:hypothetical protein [Saccharothrix tamanrassetensis]MBB5958266.1 hypothetical protein [Saccharothrix tamanrassetensis]
MPVTAPAGTPSRSAPQSAGAALVDGTTGRRQATGQHPSTQTLQGFHVTNPTTVQRVRPNRQPAVASSSSTPAATLNAPPGPARPLDQATTTATTPTSSTSRTQALPSPDNQASPDLDSLARKLIEPVSRLLRAELRSGRERAGRLHDRSR